MSAGRRKGLRPEDSLAYRQFWRIIDGAVVDAINNHPTYLRDKRLLRYMRVSVTKRAVGSLMSYAAVATQGASRPDTAVEGGAGAAEPPTDKR